MRVIPCEETTEFGLNLRRRGTQNPAPLYNRAKNRQEINASKHTGSKTSQDSDLLDRRQKFTLPQIHVKRRVFLRGLL